MTTQFFLSNFATTLASDHAIDMVATGDNVFIAPNVVVSADGAGASGIFSSFHTHRIDIAGSLVSTQFRGMDIQDPAGLGSVITITAGGGIFANNQAIFIVDTGGNRIENAGTIESFAGSSAAITVFGPGNLIHNSGSIIASNAGIFGGEADTVVNSGSIVSQNGAGVMFQTAFASISTVTNTGTISGLFGVFGSNGTEIIYNHGTIVGGVNLNFGSDQYFGDGGHVQGTISLGDGDDFGHGGDFADIFEGGTGADQLFGNGGDDVFLASSSADDNDTIDGGAGSDTYDATSAGAAVIIDLNEGSASGTSIGNDLLDSIENATGSTFADTLTGDDFANILKGLAGIDILTGAAGKDTLDGGDGADTLTGGAARDLLYGGGADGDVDIFDYNSVTESGITGGTRDAIMDFEDGFDKIDLSTIDAKTFQKGNQAFTFIGAGNFTSAGGQVRSFVNAAGNTVIQINNDHDTAAEMSIVVHGTPTLSAADFIL